MVRLAVTLALPASRTSQLLDALRVVASPIRIEPGCLGWRAWVDDTDESTVRYEEEWATDDAMRVRVRSQRFTQLLEVLESAPVAPSVKFDFVTASRGLDYVEEVRHIDMGSGAPPPEDWH